MNDLCERGLTRLSFLVDALVRSPRKYDALTGNIRGSDSPASRALQKVVRALRRAFATTFLPGLTGAHDLPPLRGIATELAHDPLEPIRIAGHALCRAIDNATAPRYPPPPSV